MHADVHPPHRPKAKDKGKDKGKGKGKKAPPSPSRDALTGDLINMEPQAPAGDDELLEMLGFQHEAKKSSILDLYGAGTTKANMS